MFLFAAHSKVSPQQMQRRVRYLRPAAAQKSMGNVDLSAVAELPGAIAPEPHADSGDTARGQGGVEDFGVSLPLGEIGSCVLPCAAQFGPDHAEHQPPGVLCWTLLLAEWSN
jgi:hypothetical protein